ncbi:MAG: hypothetical protein HQL77_08220 [Magnetococcales bacterium]|nr:hypothetical protein [Magnetococcales bacterium]
MSVIILLDTSIYLNVLDVPSFNQDRHIVLDEFENCVQFGNFFLLPLASIWETGNHIADLRDGKIRRLYAKKLVGDVKMAVKGDAPYRPTHFPTQTEFLEWLDAFPDATMRSKSSQKSREGVSLVDLSTIKEWERTKSRHPMSRVRIWSLDMDLSGYDTGT